MYVSFRRQNTGIANIHTLSGPYIHTDMHIWELKQTCIHVCTLEAPNINTYIHTYTSGVETYMHKRLASHSAPGSHLGCGSNSSRKTFSIRSPIQFFEICEGGLLLEHPYIHKGFVL